ncbi:MAG: carbohydrate ABC transporter permease [Bacteroidota bacterium]
MDPAHPSATAGRFVIKPAWGVSLAGLAALTGLLLLPLPAASKISLGSLIFLGLFLFWLARVPDRIFRYFLALPSFLVMVVVTVVPIAFLIWVSVHAVTILNFRRHWPFAGAVNYLNLLTQDPLFLPSLIRSLELLVFGILLQLGIGLALALLCHRQFRFKNLVNTILLLPVMTNSVVIGMLWKYMLNFYNGFVNLGLQRIGLPAQPWLTNEGLPLIRDLPAIGPWLVHKLNFNYAFLSIILTNTWQWAPMVFLLLLAGLSSLPEEPFEAAKVDGATAWQTLRHLTLPMLKPVIAVTIVIRGIDIMKTFGMIWALFGNAPITSTLNIHIHTVGLSIHNYGASSALSLIVAGITILIYLLFQRFFVARGERG